MGWIVSLRRIASHGPILTGRQYRRSGQTDSIRWATRSPRRRASSGRLADQSPCGVGPGRRGVDHELHAGLVEDLEAVVVELDATGDRVVEDAPGGDKGADV